MKSGEISKKIVSNSHELEGYKPALKSLQQQARALSQSIMSKYQLDKSP